MFAQTKAPHVRVGLTQVYFGSLHPDMMDSFLNSTLSPPLIASVSSPLFFPTSSSVYKLGSKIVAVGQQLDGHVTETHRISDCTLIELFLEVH